ncbi:polysaccharide ABC transporter ATP-binding protein [Christiangramia sediminis]|uniref:ATP-binding cassette domain-containing protein n=1 Tax=Christiangramia sediminis TaxID=2881336 RepID=A0A9X1LJ64_9FLAO|nr:ABC transporter ATP-binding protein [Christiangramia sediminis]MCB7481322.1 ATP-binding cassette domain-containing protein [Christiangramia sediminis]
MILKAENISKQYRLGTVGTGTLKHDAQRWWAGIRGKEDPFLKVGAVNDRSSKASEDYVWALKDINFEVKHGEVLGIIGKNGAGKSTLLKILSRVTSPTTGSIKTKGRIASLLEVGTGFHGELTGRENIFMNGAVLGMTKTEIKNKLDEIIAFSGCEKYIDTPVKRYSSGMTVRLGFAVAAHLEPEILVVDEVLAVGDAEFQKKAIGKMQDLSIGEGRTVLFVSHNMASIKSLCTSGLVLKNGSISYNGNIRKCVENYLNDDIEQKWHFTSFQNNSSAFIKNVFVRTSYKNGIHDFLETIKIEIEIYSNSTIRNPAVSYQILNNDNQPIVHELILNEEKEFCQDQGTFKLISTINQLKLYQGFYKLNVFFSDYKSGILIDSLNEICKFEVINSNKRPVYWATGSAVYKENSTNWQILNISK